MTMQILNVRFLYPAIAIAAFCAVINTAGAADDSSLLTTQQKALDKLALSLRGEPGVKAARDNAIRRLSQQPAASIPDGKATLEGAVDEIVYHALRAAAADNPARPEVAWTLTPPYLLEGKQQIPGSRIAGDNPDRIYRYAAINPAYRYEIRGQRGRRPARHEFSFESSDSMSLLHPTRVALYSKDIDVAKDGGFVVTADGMPADGRRNHLYLPTGTKVIFIRDTLPDWSEDYNKVTVTRLDSGGAQERGREERVNVAAEVIADVTDVDIRILDIAWKDPANVIKPFVRPNEWGVPGNVISFNRFSLQNDEALVITLVPSGANYLGIELMDLWSRTTDYWHRTSSLSNRQTKPNADGSITYVLSAHDPGVYNWLDCVDLQDGLIMARWEQFPQPLATGEVDKLVREVHKVKLSELDAVLPANAAKVTVAERKLQLQTRAADIARRIALK